MNHLICWVNVESAVFVLDRWITIHHTSHKNTTTLHARNTSQIWNLWTSNFFKWQNTKIVKLPNDKTIPFEDMLLTMDVRCECFIWLWKHRVINYGFIYFQIRIALNFCLARPWISNRGGTSGTVSDLSATTSKYNAYGNDDCNLPKLADNRLRAFCNLDNTRQTAFCKYYNIPRTYPISTRSLRGRYYILSSWKMFYLDVIVPECGSRFNVYDLWNFLVGF